MNSLQPYHISIEFRSERGLALLEVAMLSVVILSLFTAVMAMTERVGLYSYTNQLIENELQNQRQGLALASSDYSQSGIDRQIKAYNDGVRGKLQSRGIELSEYNLETALVRIKNTSHEVEVLSDDRNGMLATGSLKSAEIIRSYYASVSDNLNIFASGFEANYLSEEKNSNNLSTKFLISRLIIKQDRNVFRFLKYAGLENQVLTQKIIPLRLDYQL